MALSDPYATAEQYRAVIKPDAGDDADASITTDLKAVSRYLEGKLGRFFNKDAAATTVLYEPRKCCPTLPVGDYAEAPTSVLIDDDGDGTPEAALEAADYELLPLDAPQQPEPWPYTHVGLTAWGARGVWTPRVRVAVVGVRGWPAVPDAVHSGTIQLTAIYRLESPRATRRIPELGDAIESSPDAQRILKALIDQYKSGRAWGIA